MENIYSLLSVLLPFEWADHQFMKNAFLAVLLVTPLFGLLGTMVVSNRMAFFSDSLGHGAFTGIALGALLGADEPLGALIIFSIIFAALITYIKNYSRASADTVIGVFSSTAIAVGLIIMSYGGGFNKFSSYLIGDLLSITEGDLAGLLLVFIMTVAVWLVIFNRLLLISINSSLAASRGIKTLYMEIIFAALLAVVVAISIQWVGLLIINSLLVLPAAAARNITGSVKSYTAAAVLLAMAAGISGLIGAYYANTAAGASIVLVSAVFFFITLALKSRMAR